MVRLNRKSCLDKRNVNVKVKSSVRIDSKTKSIRPNAKDFPNRIFNFKELKSNSLSYYKAGNEGNYVKTNHVRNKGKAYTGDLHSEMRFVSTLSEETIKGA